MPIALPSVGGDASPTRWGMKTSPAQATASRIHAGTRRPMKTADTNATIAASHTGPRG